MENPSALMSTKISANLNKIGISFWFKPTTKSYKQIAMCIRIGNINMVDNTRNTVDLKNFGVEDGFLECGQLEDTQIDPMIKIGCNAQAKQSARALFIGMTSSYALGLDFKWNFLRIFIFKRIQYHSLTLME